MKTSEVMPPALNWLVAKCEGFETRNNKVVYFVPHEAESDDPFEFDCFADDDAHAIEQCENAYPNCIVDRVEWTTRYEPSTKWAQGGPIIEGEKIDVVFRPGDKKPGFWDAYCANTPHGFSAPTPLIAAMRCYVASKLGNEVDIPEELK